MGLDLRFYASQAWIFCMHCRWCKFARAPQGNSVAARPSAQPSAATAARRGIPRRATCKIYYAPWQFDNVSMLHCNSVVAMLLEQNAFSWCKEKKTWQHHLWNFKKQKHLLPLVGNFVQSALLYWSKYVQFWKSKLSTACFKHTNFSIIMGHLGLLWLFGASW